MSLRLSSTVSLPGALNQNDHIILLYRLLAVMAVFTMCRLLFWAFNQELISNSSPFDAFKLYLGGLRFDLSAVLLLNVLFILFSAYLNLRIPPSHALSRK